MDKLDYQIADEYSHELCEIKNSTVGKRSNL